MVVMCCLITDPLISVLSMLVESLDILFAAVVVALDPRAGYMKAEDLLSLLLLMCVFKKLNSV